MRVRPRLRAFALIELLLVIAIISLLIGILLPALAKAPESGTSIKCASQIRQNMTGMAMYQETFGFFPPHQIRLPDGSRYRWFHAMADYSESLTIIKCPSVEDWEISRNHSYGYNCKYLGSFREQTQPDNPYRPYETFPVRSVEAPSSTIALADTDGTGRILPYEREGPNQHPDRFGNHGYVLDPTFIPLRSESAASGGTPEKYAWQNHRTLLSERHLGASNAGFVDGHAARVEPPEAYKDNRM